MELEPSVREDSLAERLGRLSLFRDLPKSVLEGFCSGGQHLNVKKSSNIIIEGELTRGLYIILEGKVSVHKTDTKNNTLHRLAHLEEGDDFGELSLIDEAARSATVIAETECKLFYLDAGDFDRLMSEQEPKLQAEFFRTCAKDLASRLRQQNSDYINSQQQLWSFALRRKTDEDSDS